MAEVAILLTILTVGVSIVIGILGWLANMLIPLKTQVNEMSNAIFGREKGNSKGLTERFEQIETQFENQTQERRQEHQEVKSRMKNVEWKTTKMAQELSESDKIDISVDLSEIQNRQND